MAGHTPQTPLRQHATPPHHTTTTPVKILAPAKTSWRTPRHLHQGYRLSSATHAVSLGAPCRWDSWRGARARFGCLGLDMSCLSAEQSRSVEVLTRLGHPLDQGLLALVHTGWNLGTAVHILESGATLEVRSSDGTATTSSPSEPSLPILEDDRRSAPSQEPEPEGMGPPGRGYVVLAAQQAAQLGFHQCPWPVLEHRLGVPPKRLYHNMSFYGVQLKRVSDQASARSEWARLHPGTMPIHDP